MATSRQLLHGEKEMKFKIHEWHQRGTYHAVALLNLDELVEICTQNRIYIHLFGKYDDVCMVYIEYIDRVEYVVPMELSI